MQQIAFRNSAWGAKVTGDCRFLATCFRIVCLGAASMHCSTTNLCLKGCLVEKFWEIGWKSSCLFQRWVTSSWVELLAWLISWYEPAAASPNISTKIANKYLLLTSDEYFVQNLLSWEEDILEEVVQLPGGKKLRRAALQMLLGLLGSLW